ncbi:MAG TPA: dTMP kinase, partial [Mycobacteriales bacterium]|nr:dTMP kinase [Mycobacteriales bacterium]
IGFTALVGAFAGITWVVGLTLVGLEVSDDKRGRTFSFIYNLMRVDMLLVLAAAPFIAGTIGRHPVHLFSVVLRFDGVTITLFGAGLVAILVGVACQRLMDDHTGPHLRTELWAALRREAAGTGRPVGHGLLVAFEGGEGSGKSTQVALLARWLDERGFDVVVTREPGATVIGARLRGLLLDRGTAGLAARAEALLYAADRAQHVAELIRPALDRGAVVLSDRYVDSSLAYQGAGRALEVAELARLSRWATGGLAADLTVVLDIDPVVGLGRVSGTGDRIEDESVEFHTRVRSAFLALAHRHQRRYLVLDAGQQVEEVQARIRERIERALPTIRTPQRSPIGVPDQ